MKSLKIRTPEKGINKLRRKNVTDARLKDSVFGEKKTVIKIIEREDLNRKIW